MTADYRDSHLSYEKGESYQRTFIEKPYRRMVWKFEREILDKILKTFFAGVEVHHLDFACGTGRVLSYLEARVCTSVGVDLSPGMLEVARRNQKRGEIFQADLTRDDVLGDRKFNLITAFRFFPNAQPELRMEAMQVLIKHLDEDGYLIFNNHKNTGSLRNRLMVLFRHRGYDGMSLSDTQELLARNGMEIVKIFHLCIFPAYEGRMLLPLSLLRLLEGAFARVPALGKLAENLLFVCRRKKT